MNAAYMAPAITLFNQDGTLDFESQEKLFDNLIEKGVDGILVEGSSSEFFAMPMGQRREMAKFAIEKVNRRVKLIMGTSHMVADEIINFSNFCLDAGADAVMILPPYYFHFGHEALLQYYDRLARQIHVLGGHLAVGEEFLDLFFRGHEPAFPVGYGYRVDVTGFGECQPRRFVADYFCIYHLGNMASDGIVGQCR